MSNYNEVEYWNDVEDIAKEFIEYETSPGYELHEAVDQTRWIIYNAGSYAVIQYTANEDAIFDELGREAYRGADCFEKVVQWTASFAMQADVRERAEELKEEMAE